MPDFAAWLNDTEAIDAEPRAVLAWKRIKDKPTSVAFRKPDGTTLASQTVRVELSEFARDAASPAGSQTVRQAIVFGVRDHDTVTDTDVKSGYTFILNNREYRVADVVETLGEVQARAEVVS